METITQSSGACGTTGCCAPVSITTTTAAPAAAVEPIREQVRQHYAERAVAAHSGCSSTTCCDPISTNLYDLSQLDELPEKAVNASLGCGNPTLLAKLAPGETVLDLGSGGGIDVLLSAKRVGPTGKAYGLDMTDEMLALARENQKTAGVTNAEFLKGHLEEIPLPDSTVDVILSNCVINLSADKDRVLREAYRVLKPGGRIAVADILTKDGLPVEIKRSMELWAGCVAGAMEESEYKARLEAAGFRDVSIEPIRTYDANDARGFLAGSGLDADAIIPQVDGKVLSGFVSAYKRA